MTETTRRELLSGAVSSIVAGCAATPSFAGAFHGDGFDPSELRAMRGLAAEFMDNYGVPGLSIAISKDGRLVFEEAFGVADKPDEKLTAQHRMRIASVSKPITSVTIMSLVESGRLSLSDRVFGKEGVLGNDFGTPPYKEYVEQITLAHLLTHTAGGWGNGGPDPDPMFTNPQMDHAKLIGWTLDNLPLRHAPGEQFAYSNLGYCVLGRVIEKRTGVKYADYVRDNVLKRCRITDMEIAGNTLEDRKSQESVYFGQKRENPYGMQVARMDAHGGWIATPTDLVRFISCVEGAGRNPPLLKPSSVRTLTTPTEASKGYALGLMVNQQNNWWHNGSLPGTGSLMVRTSQGLRWAAIANTRRPSSQFDLALDRLLWNMVKKVTVWPEFDLF